MDSTVEEKARGTWCRHNKSKMRETCGHSRSCTMTVLSGQSTGFKGAKCLVNREKRTVCLQKRYADVR